MPSVRGMLNVFSARLSRLTSKDKENLSCPGCRGTWRVKGPSAMFSEHGLVQMVSHPGRGVGPCNKTDPTIE